MVRTIVANPLKYSWLVCPVCHRRNYYYRRKTKDFCCNLCPTIFRGDYDYKITYSIPKKEVIK